jgi:hypothetical protein
MRGFPQVRRDTEGRTRRTLFIPLETGKFAASLRETDESKRLLPVLECFGCVAVTVLDARSIGKAVQPVKQKTCQINEVREEKTFLANDPERRCAKLGNPKASAYLASTSGPRKTLAFWTQVEGLFPRCHPERA